MRKHFFIFLSVFILFTITDIDLMAISKSKLLDLFDEVKSYEGVDVVKIGSLGTSAIKSLIKLGSKVEDDDARNALEVIKGINKLVVLDFDGCGGDDKKHIADRIKGMLGSSDLLMEVNDGDDHMEMYGIVGKDGSEIRDFVLYDSEGCELICLFGQIKMNALMRLTE